MKIKNSILVLLIFVFFFGGIMVADNLGYWQTESNKAPRKITSGTFQGMPDPADIRGSYSFSDIEDAFDVEASILAKAFHIESNDPQGIQAKELEEIYTDLGEDIEIGTGSIRFFVAVYAGLPYEGVEYLPDTAVKVLKEEGKWTDDIQLKTEGYIVPIGNASEIPKGNPDNEEIEHDESIRVNGRTTFRDVIGWGISKEELEEIMGITIENENLSIRDVCDQNGLSFGQIKTSINEKLVE